MGTFKQYIKGLVISFILAIILLCLIGLLLAYTNLNDNLLLPLVFAVIIVTNLIGASITGRKIKKKGIIVGAVFGIIYFLVLYFISVIFYSGFFINEAAIVYLIMTAISGGIGGVIGVNV